MKSAKILLLAVATLCALISLCACGGGADNTPVHTHVFGEWYVTKKATCSTSGTEERYCDCGQVQSKNLPALDHNIVTYAAIAPTCSAAGITEGKQCSLCNEVMLAQQTIPMIAHTYDDKYDETCNECGHIRDAQCAHAETEVLKGYAATCTYAGLTDGTKCKKCGEILTQQVATNIVPHVEAIDEAVSATCTSTGLTEGKHCSICKTVIVAQTETAMLGHTYSDDLDTTCENCGFTRDVECYHTNVTILPARAATCTVDGITEGMICDRCELILQPQTVIAAKGHTEVTDPAVAATCTTAGVTEGKHCSTCGEVTVAQKRIAALGHNESDWIVDREATDDQDGQKHTECTMCGQTLNEVIIPMAGLRGFAYRVNADNVSCTITGIGNFTDPNVIIPTSIDGYTVTAIGYGAFDSRMGITSVVIPDTVTSVGDYAFRYCYDLVDVYFCHTTPPQIGSDVFCSIWDSTYFNINVLEEAYSSYMVIDADYWQGYAVDNIRKWNGCFHSYDSIITEPTKHTDGYTTYICNTCGHSYEDNYVPATGSLGLAYTVNTDNISCTITGIGTCTDSHVTIPTSIDGYTVTSIATRAFYNCTGITEITIPASVYDIGTQIFYKASNLATVYYNSTYGSETNQFLNLSHITKIVFGGRYVPSYICKGSTALQTVEILDSVTWIGNSAFSGCTGLTSIVIGDSVTGIGDSAFSGCTGLKDVYITDINAWCNISFSNYTSNPMYNGANLYLNGNLVTEVTVPDTVNSLEYTFAGCKSIVSVTIHDSVTSIGSDAFWGCTGLTSIVIPDSVTSIGSSAFSGCTGLTSIVIPDSVTSIGGSAFDACTGLTSIVIPDSVTSINNWAFNGCTGLTSIVIPDSVTSIGQGAFSGCTGLTSIEIPDGVTSIDSCVFRDCTGLTSIVIPDRVTWIGWDAFSGCTCLTSIVIPDSVTSIGSDAFWGCTGLTDVYYTGTEAEWASISIDSYNWYLTNATIHYNYVPAN